ncbi:hypothetical protein LEMLEM_LOCUS8405, partial [Lemmus lemmus]
GSAGAPWGGRRVSGDGAAQSSRLWGEPGREARAFPGASRVWKGCAGDPVRARASRAGLRGFPLASVSEACREPLAPYTVGNFPKTMATPRGRSKRRGAFEVSSDGLPLRSSGRQVL